MRTSLSRSAVRVSALLAVLALLTACSSTDPAGTVSVATPTQQGDPTADPPPTSEPTPTMTAGQPSATEPAVSPSAVPAGSPSAAGDTTETSSANYPVTVTADNGEVTIEDRPERIVSLSPTATEMLFAIGAGDEVIAADEYSNYPEEAPTTDLSGFQPNVEAILAENPDLVVASSDPGDLVAGLEAAGVPVLLYDSPADLDGSYSQIEQLGAATGRLADAAEVVKGMQGDIDALIDGMPTLEEPLTYYHELDPSLFSVTSDTFIGEVYSMLGLESIADAAEDAGGYPQLNAEFVAESDPDFVFLADTKCCEVDAEEFASRPGFEGLSAVERGAVVELDDDIASRWGPRITQFLEVVAAAVKDNLPQGASTG